MNDTLKTLTNPNHLKPRTQSHHAHIKMYPLNKISVANQANEEITWFSLFYTIISFTHYHHMIPNSSQIFMEINIEETKYCMPMNVNM